ncbi:hypothetical protein EJ08DRAFT_662648 [Tothia fuscella]|uniref:Uncharacterized protein n=1 Tax=Tothia fuscella TaxID=1048955 RepID=A0A9P4NMK3_9PEZI|nr:hypothetical protein EJ08DRAFT_662648 [Tothia fuscella]
MPRGLSVKYPPPPLVTPFRIPGLDGVDRVEVEIKNENFRYVRTAVAAIPAGTVLFSETPLLTYKTRTDRVTSTVLINKFSKLPVDGDARHALARLEYPPGLDNLLGRCKRNAFVLDEREAIYQMKFTARSQLVTTQTIQLGVPKIVEANCMKITVFIAYPRRLRIMEIEDAMKFDKELTPPLTAIELANYLIEWEALIAAVNLEPRLPLGYLSAAEHCRKLGGHQDEEVRIHLLRWRATAKLHGENSFLAGQAWDWFLWACNDHIEIRRN